jgi:hypothetical protein
MSRGTSLRQSIHGYKAVGFVVLSSNLDKLFEITTSMGKKPIKKDSMLSGIDNLDNDSRVRVLGIIDKLRELGVSETVSLPQVRENGPVFKLLLMTLKLVVVGDQSSGKSSLLEALTGLSFPIASDLCTRYATQIVLRRSKLEDAGAKISIIPGRTAQADDEIRERLLSFERSVPLDHFGVAEFTRIFDEVGIPYSKYY